MFVLKKIKQFLFRNELAINALQSKIIIGLSCCLLLALAYLMDWQPQFEKIQKIKQTNDEISKEFNKKERLITQLTLQEKQTNSLHSSFQWWQKQLLTEQQSIALLEELNRTAQENQVEIRWQKLLPEEKSTDWLIKTVHLNAQGNYHQLAQFVTQIIQLQGLLLPYKMIVAKNSGNQNIDQTSNRKLSIDLIIKAYISPALENKSI